MTERYDAAIIGAGPDGLAAAALLARAGLSVIVLERHTAPGGRLVTRQFHPGFYAAPFADTVAPVPDDLFRALDLARHGAWRAPAMPVPPATARLNAEAGRRRAVALAQARHLVPPPARWSLFAAVPPQPWPEESWALRALADVVAEHVADPDEAARAIAEALDGRAADPFQAGSALHLLATRDEGLWRGALGGLGDALTIAARDAGAKIDCGLDVTDIRCARGRVCGLCLADGREIAARAVLSTLDLKRTFLSLFAWSELPRPVVARIAHFRLAGAAARLLVALAAPPPRAPRGPVRLLTDPRDRLRAHAAWRGNVLAEHLPLTVRFPARSDPALAPPGAAVMTVTVACVPHALFDGAWSHEKRDLLARRVLDDIEQAFPGLGAGILAHELLVPPDIEEALGATAGDLDGGEIAPDQMFGFRPGFARPAPRTPVEGLYLAGPSSAAAPFGTCAAGAVAAAALLADLRAGRLK